MRALRPILSVITLGLLLAIASIQGAQAASLTTTFASNNGCSSGNYFDVTVAGNPLTVTQFAVNTSAANTTVNVYTRPGTFIGNTSSPAGWTLVGSVAVVGAGTDNPTLADIPDFRRYR